MITASFPSFHPRGSMLAKAFPISVAAVPGAARLSLSNEMGSRNIKMPDTPKTAGQINERRVIPFLLLIDVGAVRPKRGDME